MNKFMKAIAAIMLMTVVVCAAGCKKDDSTNNTGNNNYPGGGGGYHEFVDLGLPSGTLWATCNVGAAKPEDYGDYFAWGETTPKTTYNWSTYKYCNGGYDQLTKYCNSFNYGYNGFTDNLTTLQPSDDAATANWGSGWCTPTKEQWQELIDNTSDEWTTRNDVYGRVFHGNGQSLFLPAAGAHWDDELYNAGSLGFSWSSSCFTNNPDHAFYFNFYLDGYGVYGLRRDSGFSVRPVRKN